MGQKTILTPIQRKFLDLVQAKSYLTKRYYWLHHRDSEDIDLFCVKFMGHG